MCPAQSIPPGRLDHPLVLLRAGDWAGVHGQPQVHGGRGGGTARLLVVHLRGGMGELSSKASTVRTAESLQAKTRNQITMTFKLVCLITKGTPRRFWRRYTLMLFSARTSWIPSTPNGSRSKGRLMVFSHSLGPAQQTIGLEQIVKAFPDLSEIDLIRLLSRRTDNN